MRSRPESGTSLFYPGRPQSDAICLEPNFSGSHSTTRRSPAPRRFLPDWHPCRFHLSRPLRCPSHRVRQTPMLVDHFCTLLSRSSNSSIKRSTFHRRSREQTSPSVRVALAVAVAPLPLHARIPFPPKSRAISSPSQADSPPHREFPITIQGRPTPSPSYFVSPRTLSLSFSLSFSPSAPAPNPIFSTLISSLNALRIARAKP